MWEAVKSINQEHFGSMTKANTSSTLEGLYQSDELPLSLALLYLAGNTVLLFLNFYWFWAMVQALMKRFDTPMNKKPIEKQR